MGVRVLRIKKHAWGVLFASDKSFEFPGSVVDFDTTWAG
ncbi:hypothetical protein HPS_0918 [Glaesserella parasuis 29755]|nr:hypothetical protein HPS_0918 [Glaesserella parasuis 29755]